MNSSKVYTTIRIEIKFGDGTNKFIDFTYKSYWFDLSSAMNHALPGVWCRDGIEDGRARFVQPYHEEGNMYALVKVLT